LANTKSDLAPQSSENDPGEFLAVVDMRLKKLRRERHLVERAIVVLTQISRARESRDRRASRS